MKKIIFIIAIALLVILSAVSYLYLQSNISEISDFESCIAAGNPAMESFPRQCRANGQIFIEVIKGNSQLNKYFANRIIERAVEIMGVIPIEGYDPDLLKGPFPALLDKDFDGAEAISGKWRLIGGELNFVRSEEEFITSADGTLTQEGLATLLDNLSKRLKIIPDSKSNIDRIITTIEKSNIKIMNDFGNRIIYSISIPEDLAPYKQDCSRRGGKFNECGSPCSDESEVCIAVCALTCENL
jgi:hypothetical protein